MKDYLNLEHMPSNDDAKRHEASRNSRRGKLALKIIIWVVLGILALYLIGYIAIPPINSLKLKMLVMQNYEVEVRARNSTTLMKVDGRYISVESEEGYSEAYVVYYERDKDGIYNHRQNKNGEWERIKTDLDEIVLGGGSSSDISLDTLLRKRNYVWAPMMYGGGIRTYRLKSKVEFKYISSIAFRVSGGEYSFVLMPENGSVVRITIKNIGFTQVEKPWES